jgi:hypothetical protein
MFYFAHCTSSEAVLSSSEGSPSRSPRDCFAGIGISAECNITDVDGD